MLVRSLIIARHNLRRDTVKNVAVLSSHQSEKNELTKIAITRGCVRHPPLEALAP